MQGVAGRVLLFIKHIFLALARGFRKIVCIGRRKKVQDDSDPTSVVVITGAGHSPTLPPISSGMPFPNDSPQYPLYNPHQQPMGNVVDNQSKEWDSWDTEFEPTQQDCSVVSPETKVEESQHEDDIDFFKDMEPTVKVKKVFVKRRAEAAARDLLSMDKDLEFTVSDELEEWDDDDGWEDDDLDIDEAKVLREAQEERKRERQMRAKQHRSSKTTSRAHEKLASRVS